MTVDHPQSLVLQGFAGFLFVCGRPSYLYPLAPVGEGLAPSRRVRAAPFDLEGFRRPGGQATSILIWIWPVHSHCTPDPVYGGAWFGGLAQTYRRGVVSDTKLFSRPLPLCGDDQRTTASTRLDAPPLVLPRGAEGVGWRNPVGRGLAPAVVLHCILGDFVGAAPRGRPQVHSVCPPRHSEAPEGPWESVFPGRGMRIATSGLRPSSQ